MDPNPNYVVLHGEFDAPKGNLEPYLKLMKESSEAMAGFVKKGISRTFILGQIIQGTLLYFSYLNQ